MNLHEFNRMTLKKKHDYLFPDQKDSLIKYISFREEDDQSYSLWGFEDFLIEMKYSRSGEEVIKMEALDHNDRRLDLYIEFMNTYFPKYEES